jgi:cbb3-type cytochrome oxidase maturation protein
LAAFFAVAVVGVLVWAVGAGQFEDLEGPAHRILWEEPLATIPPPGGVSTPTYRGGDAARSLGDDVPRHASEDAAEAWRR